MKFIICLSLLLSILTSFTTKSLASQTNDAQTLTTVIEDIYGQSVLEYHHEQETLLTQAAMLALQKINKNGITANRVNEIGNAVEPYVIEALNEMGFNAHIPPTQTGHSKSTGYPDIRAKRENDVFYIEVKTYHPQNEQTTYRTFYLSPSNDPKVTQPAFHLLIAFAMLPDENKNYFAQKVSLLDIANLHLHLKMEFNASNRDLYSSESHLIFTQPSASLIPQ